MFEEYDEKIMSIKTIKDNIILTPNELHNIIDNINKKVKLKIGSCSKDNGYIIDIKNIKIQYNIICRYNGDCDYFVLYDILYLKPEKGHIYECTVKLIHEYGVICMFKCIEILVPKDMLSNWTFNPITLEYKKDDRIISVNSIITIRVFLTQYKYNKIQCIGELI